MSFTGYHSTIQGRELIAKLLAGETLEVTRVHSGSGICPEESEIDGLRDLISPRLAGTSTKAIYENQTMSMTVQFFSTENTGDSFDLTEFGIYAKDPEEGEILMYYFSQGDSPVRVFAANDKCASIAQFEISVFVGEDLEGVHLGYPLSTFVSHETLDSHNTAQTAHENLMHPRIQLAVQAEIPTAQGVFLWIDQAPKGFSYPSQGESTTEEDFGDSTWGDLADTHIWENLNQDVTWGGLT